MASPRPSGSEFPAKPTRGRAPLVAVAALLVAVAVCVAIAWWTGTGVLGFGVALGVVLTLGVGAVLLRELRRQGRAIRRVERGRRRSETDARTALGRLARQGRDEASATRALRQSVDELGTALAAQQRSLDLITAELLETNRVVAAGLRPETLSRALATQLQQEQALLNLFALAPVRGVVPTMGGWAASADVVALLVRELLRIRPALVMECGSGVSTLWLALTIEQHGLATRVVSLDHDPHFAEQTRRSLRAHGVERHVEVRDAPLVPVDLPGHSTPWYDRSSLAGLDGVGLLFVDGPPDATGPLVRYPAVPVLKPLFAPTVTVVLDDLIRPAEKEVVERWRLQLPDFDLEQLPLQKSAAVFRRSAIPARD